MNPTSTPDASLPSLHLFEFDLSCRAPEPYKSFSGAVLATSFDSARAFITKLTVALAARWGLTVEDYEIRSLVRLRGDCFVADGVLDPEWAAAIYRALLPRSIVSSL